MRNEKTLHGTLSRAQHAAGAAEPALGFGPEGPSLQGSTTIYMYIYSGRKSIIFEIFKKYIYTGRPYAQKISPLRGEI